MPKSKSEHKKLGGKSGGLKKAKKLLEKAENVPLGCVSPTGCLVGEKIGQSAPSGSVKLECSGQQCTQTLALHSECFAHWRKELINRVEKSPQVREHRWREAWYESRLFSTPGCYGYITQQCRCPCGGVLRPLHDPLAPMADEKLATNQGIVEQDIEAKKKKKKELPLNKTVAAPCKSAKRAGSGIGIMGPVHGPSTFNANNYHRPQQQGNKEKPAKSVPIGYAPVKNARKTGQFDEELPRNFERANSAAQRELDEWIEAVVVEQDAMNPHYDLTRHCKSHVDAVADLASRKYATVGVQLLSIIEELEM